MKSHLETHADNFDSSRIEARWGESPACAPVAATNPEVENTQPCSRKRVLSLAATCFPSVVQPVHSVFVKERLRFVNRLSEVEIRVLSPIPYFPPIPWFKRWYPWSQIPHYEVIDGLEVYRPRYFLPPALGGYLHPLLIRPAAQKAMRAIRSSFDFNLIDAHFVYPNGALAADLARKYDIPFVITGRGEDILRFPKLPMIGPQIRVALRRASHLIALSVEIADAMIDNGAARDRISVIPNGVDLDKFTPVAMDVARTRTNLPFDRPIVVTTGYRIERKGFHILADALPKIRERFPNILLVIVGGEARWESDYLPVIEERIRAHELQDHVRLVGNIPQEELLYWYGAADVFALLTSREGCPNVLLEALACGVPSVATRVGGIPEILNDPQLGLLLDERSADSAADGVCRVLSQTWDRTAIRQFAELQSWNETARKVNDAFDQAMQSYRPRWSGK